MDDEEEGDVMPSRSQKSKKRMEVEVENMASNSGHAGLKKKRTMRKDGEDSHATTSARTTKRADNSRHPPKPKSIRRLYAIYFETPLRPPTPL